MTYGDLPSVEASQKLTMVSFDSPQKNLNVYRFAEALSHHQNYVENEKRKLLERLGTPVENRPGLFALQGDKINEYNQRLREILSAEIDVKLPPPGIVEDDFSEEKCCYPADKSLWISASDIAAILNFSKQAESRDA